MTEPFGARERVKVDDPAKHRSDVIDVLKLNLVRDFQTGIYDYNTMVSTFVRVADLAPLKVSFTSAEWCGNVYEEMRIDPDRIAQRVSSYFEGESGERTIRRPNGGLLEDEILIRVRGLHGDWLRPGERRTVPFLAGTFWRRLAHWPAEWTTATIERQASPLDVRVPAGAFRVARFLVRTGDGREGVFDVELAEPRRVVRWEWKAAGAVRPGLGGADRAELTGSRRLPTGSSTASATSGISIRWAWRRRSARDARWRSVRGIGRRGSFGRRRGRIRRALDRA